MKRLVYDWAPSTLRTAFHLWAVNSMTTGTLIPLRKRCKAIALVADDSKG